MHNMVMVDIYNKLGLKYIDLKKTISYECLQKYFDIENISNFNPFYSLFSSNELYSKSFNNSFSLFKLLGKGLQINDNGYIFKSLIKKKKKNIYSKIFIKELCYLDLLNIHIDFENNNSFYNNYLLSKVFCLKNSVNIEIFVSYLTSKLVENKICPHFCVFYGFNNVLKGSFCKMIDEYDLEKFQNEINPEIKYNIINDNDNIYLERYKVPCALIYTEKLDEFYKITYKINSENEWLSYIFQIIFSLCIAQKYFGLSHNDLHLSNLMYRKTKKKYLYYKINNRIYKIPTYSKIIKIIDWGRSTFSLKEKFYNNDIFSSEGVAFGQYIPYRLKGKKEIKTNMSSDLSILACNLLIESNFPKSGKLNKFIKNFLKYGDNKTISFNKNGIKFDTYIEIAKYCENAIPIEVIQNDIFNIFIVENCKKSIIYEY